MPSQLAQKVLTCLANSNNDNDLQSCLASSSKEKGLRGCDSGKDLCYGWYSARLNDWNGGSGYVTVNSFGIVQAYGNDGYRKWCVNPPSPLPFGFYYLWHKDPSRIVVANTWGGYLYAKYSLPMSGNPSTTTSFAYYGTPDRSFSLQNDSSNVIQGPNC